MRSVISDDYIRRGQRDTSKFTVDVDPRADNANGTNFITTPLCFGKKGKR